MSYRLLKTLCFSSLCILTVACASTPTHLDTPAKISSWETPLPGKQGAIKITFTLPEKAVAEIQLFNGKSQYISNAKARVKFTNENCTSGHQTSINYKKTNLEYHLAYFEKEAPWNKTNTVTLTWNTDNKIITTLNDESISTEITGTVNKLRIVSYQAPIDIQKIEYLPQ